MYLFLENIFSALLMYNEPVRYAIAAAKLGPLEKRLCEPYFGNLDKWHSAVFVQAPWFCLR